MTRAEILKEYKVVNGVIRDPGKFEGEPVYAPYFWDAALDGDGQEVGDEESVTEFEVNASDLESFPELDGVVRVHVWESSDGFVNTCTFED